MSQYLGVDFKFDVDLRETIISACCAPLPNNMMWTPYTNNEGFVFLVSPDETTATWCVLYVYIYYIYICTYNIYVCVHCM